MKIDKVLESLTSDGSPFHLAITLLVKKLDLMSVLDLAATRFPWYAVFLVNLSGSYPTNVNHVVLSTSSIPFRILKT